MSAESFAVRRFAARDREAVLALWPVAVKHLQPTSEPIDALINAIAGAIAGKHHVWIAETSDRIIGCVAVICDNASLAHLKCLCVAPNLVEQQVVAMRLADMAIRDASERGYLKLVVHTSSSPNQLTAFLHNLGFAFSREHATGGEHLLEFYLNLYDRPRLSSSRKSRGVSHHDTTNW